MTTTDDDFDPSVLSRLASELGADAKSVLCDIIDQFLGDLPSGLNAIDAARGDANALTAAAHRLKGQALTMGCSRLASSLASIERLARQSDLAAAVADVAGLSALAARAEAGLQQYRKALPAS